MNNEMQMKMADNKKISSISISQHPSISNIPISGIPISTHISLPYILLISTYIFLSLCILFFPTSVSAFTISKSTGNTIGLVGWWTFDKMTTGQVTDWSGLGNHGQAVNMSTSTMYTKGRIGQALQFDGASSQHIRVTTSIPSGGVLDLDGRWTMGAWVQWNGVSYVRGIVMTTDPSSNTTGIRNSNSANSGRFSFIQEGGTPASVSFNCTTINPVKDQWYHVVGTWDGTTGKLYVNGSFCNSATGSSDYDSAGDQFNIGTENNNSANDMWGGKIDDVRVYNRVLTATEVMGLYKLGEGRTATNVKGPTNGLVGHWTFDGKDMKNGRVDDISGNNNHGQQVNMSTSSAYVKGRLGQALLFDGSNDAVIATGVPVNTTANATNTIAFWMYWNGTVGSSGFASVVNTGTVSGGSCGSGSTALYGLTFNPTYFGVNTCSSDVTGIVNAGLVKKWVHVAALLPNNTAPTVTNVLLYIDGVRQTLATVGGAVARTLSSRVSIGNDPGPNNFAGIAFPGRLDDIRIYNRALSADEIRELYALGADTKVNATPDVGTGLKSGLVGHWTFDGKDMKNGRVDDISGQGNHGSAVSMSTSTMYAKGKIGQALKFDGVDDYVTTTDMTVLEGSSYATWSFWLMPKGVYNGFPIITKWNSNNAEPAVRILTATACGGTDDVAFYMEATANVVCSTTNMITDNVWRHVVIVYDGTQTGNTNRVKIYIDGNQQTASNGGTIPATFPATNSNMTFGAYSNGGFFATQILDDVRVYNRVLSASEIKQLYNAGR